MIMDQKIGVIGRVELPFLGSTKLALLELNWHTRPF